MMSSTLLVRTDWLVFFSITCVFAIIYPFILAILARIRLGVPWRYFWYGTLVFLVFQLLTRVPAVYLLTNAFSGQLRASAIFRFVWVVLLALTAGLFEEVGRYVGYRVFMGREEKTWRKAVMYGIGHGGIESVVLIGGAGLLTIVNILVLSGTNLDTLPISQHQQVLQQVAALNAQPAWLALSGAWERLWTLPIHISLSVVVLQVFKRNNIVWLWIAVLAHAIVDFTAAEIPQLLGAGTTTTLIVEGIVMLFGLIAIFVIWRLRDESPETGSVVRSQPALQSL